MREPSVLDELHRYLEYKKKQAVKPYTKELHKYAEENSTWPIEIIKQLKVKYEDGHHPIIIPDAVKDEVATLENDNRASGGLGMLRNFMLEHR